MTGHPRTPLNQTAVLTVEADLTDWAEQHQAVALPDRAGLCMSPTKALLLLGDLLDGQQPGVGQLCEQRLRPGG